MLNRTNFQPQLFYVAVWQHRSGNVASHTRRMCWHRVHSTPSICAAASVDANWRYERANAYRISIAERVSGVRHKRRCGNAMRKSFNWCDVMVFIAAKNGDRYRVCDFDGIRCLITIKGTIRRTQASPCSENVDNWNALFPRIRTRWAHILKGQRTRLWLPGELWRFQFFRQRICKWTRHVTRIRIK